MPESNNTGCASAEEEDPAVAKRAGWGGWTSEGSVATEEGCVGASSRKPGLSSWDWSWDD